MTAKKRIAAVVTAILLLMLNTGIYFADSDKEDEIVLPVLMYHNIVDGYAEGTEGANITPELFKKHMQGILARGYTPIFVADYYNYIVRGKALPENPIAITFDDGYLSNYTVAYPILKELNIPATIFVVTSTVGLGTDTGKVSYPHFTWEQAREMQQSGIVDIQSHSHTHKRMSELSIAELQMELRLSKYYIEKNLDKNCYIFAYPYGGYDEDTFRMAKYAGYKMQILVNDAEKPEDFIANTSKNGLEKFTRITVGGNMSVEDLYQTIDIAVRNIKDFAIK